MASTLNVMLKKGCLCELFNKLTTVSSRSFMLASVSAIMCVHKHETGSVCVCACVSDAYLNLILSQQSKEIRMH